MAASISGAQTVRLADVLAALSLATDLADGFPPETALKSCFLAVGIGEELGYCVAWPLQATS